MTRSADGSSSSAARFSNALSIGTRARICPTRRTRLGRINGGAFTVEAGIACSKPACAAMVSRSDSVHVTSASRETICRCSALDPPNSFGHSSTRAAIPAAATGHRVNANVSAPTATAPRTRPAIAGERIAAAARSARDGGRVGSTVTPRRPMIHSSTPPPSPAPSSTGNHTDPIRLGRHRRKSWWRCRRSRRPPVRRGAPR